MDAYTILVVAIFTIPALILVVIGLIQFRKREEPVGFYSGVQPPKKEEITDVIRWNRMHGLMWIGFGLFMEAGSILGMMVTDLVWTLVFTMGGVMLPLPFLMWMHHRMEKKYRK